MITCEYCLTEQEKAQRCNRCGAILPIAIIERASPWYYRGFMIWPERDYSRDKFIFHIWQGEVRKHTFEINRRDLYDLVPDGCSYDPFLLDMIKLAIGEKECIKIEKQNMVGSCTFHVTKVQIKQENRYEMSSAE